MIKRNITPEAPKIAIPTTTFIIIFFPQLGSPVAIIIPQTTIKTNDRIKITVTNIFVKLHISTGKAVSQVTLVSSVPLSVELDSMQLPINGTLVFNDIPQQTPESEQGLHTPSIFLVQSGQEQTPNEFITHPLGPSPKSQPAHKFDSKACCPVSEHTMFFKEVSYFTTLHAFALQV